MLKVEVNKAKIYGLLLCIYVFLACLIPADYMSLKKIFGIFFIAISIPIMIVYRNKWNAIIVLFGILFPVTTIAFSVLTSNAAFSLVLSRGYIGLYLLMVVPILYFDLNYERILMGALKTISIIIIVGVALDMMNVLNVYQNPLYTFLRITENAKIGKSRSLISFGYMIYLKAVTVLVFLLGKSIERKNIKWIVLSLVAIFFSGSRALWLTSAVLFVIILFSSEYLRNSKFKIAITLLTGVLVFTFRNDIIDVLENAFALKQSGDIVRNGQLASEIIEITKSPATILFGSGYGNSFSSIGRQGDIIFVTELSYFELIRQNGLFGFIFFMTFLIFPMKTLWIYDRSMFWSYIMYLVIAYTNPLLYTSTGYVVYVLVYSTFIRIKLNEEQKEIEEAKDE